MKKIVLLSILFFEFKATCFSQQVIANKTKSQLQQLFNAYHTGNYPYSFGLLVGNEKEVLFKGAHGFSNYELKIPHKENGIFRLASVSKQFTAILALVLQEKGVIDVQRPISTYVPKLDGHEIGTVSLYHILTNTAGIPNDVYVWDYANLKNQSPFSTDVLLDSRASIKLLFKPGEKFSYSNAGFVLAGCIMEKITGKSYEQLLNEHLFLPLGMTGTGIDHAYSLISGKVNNYEIL